MMTMLPHDDVKEASSAMMQASPAYLPILLRIIDQEQPVAAYRYNPILTFYPITLHHRLTSLFVAFCTLFAIVQL